MLSAVLLSTDHRYDVETVRRFYCEAMRENAFMRFAAAHSDHYTEKGRQKLKWLGTLGKLLFFVS